MYFGQTHKSTQQFRIQNLQYLTVLRTRPTLYCCTVLACHLVQLLGADDNPGGMKYKHLLSNLTTDYTTYFRGASL